MLFDVSSLWPVEVLDKHTRKIAGHVVTFNMLALRERYRLGLLFADAFKDITLSLNVLSDPALLELFERLIALSDAQEELFETDLTLQLPVAICAADINFAGLFDAETRMLLHEAKHPAVKKLLNRKIAVDDAPKLAPTVQAEWFLWRPVVQEVCSYTDMFVAERFTFGDIHLMHQMLDLKQYSEILANHVED